MHRLTSRQNGPRRPGRPNQVRGEQVRTAKLTEKIVHRIRELRNEGLSLPKIAAHADVQQRESAVRRVIYGHGWAWLK